MGSGPEALELRRVTAFSRGIFGIPHLDTLLGVEDFVSRSDARDNPKGLDAVVGWGFKASATRARAFAARHGIRYVALEDGFLRSAGNSPVKLPPISIVLDDLGIYYEARQPSRLEAMIAAAGDDDSLLDLGRRARARMLELRLTKYNSIRQVDPESLIGRPRRLLLVDQTFNDQSVVGAGANAATFARMLESALERYSADEIVVKAHPDVVAGRARGYLDQEAITRGLILIDRHVSTHDVLPLFDEVWTVSSGFGFEALMAGRTVRCFGASFYAGWGLTDDSMLEPRAKAWLARRKVRIDADQLAAAALVAYPRYADPVRSERVDVLTAMDRLAAWRDRYAAERRSFVGIGLSKEKRIIARSLFGAGPGTLAFADPDVAVDLAAGAGAGLLAWADRIDPRIEDEARRRGLDVTRFGTGPIDASGIASEAVPLPTVAVDDLGIDFDATRPSAFEAIANTHEFEDDLLRRAADLRVRLVALDQKRSRSDADLRQEVGDKAGGKPVVLVIGEAVNTAQSRLGTSGVASNRALVRAARAARPDGHVVFLEPPGLESRRRAGWLPAAALRPDADQVVRPVHMASLFAIADEVHVNTSRFGFDAILHGCRVVCWGKPAYAGWGLTDDRVPNPRRVRVLDRDDLVAAALLVYPRYVDPVSGILCEAEDLIARLETMRSAEPKPVGLGRRLRNRLIRWEATLRHAVFGSPADPS